MDKTELANSESLLLKCTDYAIPKDQEETVLMPRLIKGKKKMVTKIHTEQAKTKLLELTAIVIQSSNNMTTL